MFMLIILKHVIQFGSFRMEYCDTLRGVYAKATVRLICSTGLVQSSARYMPHDHTI